MHVGALAFGVALSLCLVWGCGGSDGGGSSNPSGPTPPAGGGNETPPLVINIVGAQGTQSFSPNPATIPAGRTVVWRNTDAQVHRVRLNDLSIDTGNIPPGGTSQPVTVGSAPRPYHCPLHPGMVGSLNEAEGGAEPPQCEPGDLYC